MRITPGQIEALCAAIMAGFAVAGVLMRIGRREARIDAAIEHLTWLVDWLVEIHTDMPRGDRDALVIPHSKTIPPRRRRHG